ncbi:MAG TPA: helix-turn-helix domain-containing protein [Metabacillus sp.]|nr:helix-turn-helix domain-containing protein [Metabacillus sp.]
MVRQRLTQKERKEETRKLLLESAVEIFAEFGFHGSSVEKIAEHAGFSKGAVYGHFDSKEDLFLALLERQMELHIKNVHQLIEQQYSLSEIIDQMEEYFHMVKEENRTWSMLNMEFLLYAMRNESARKQWSEMITKSVGQISKSIEILMAKENHEITLSSVEIAWTILALENGMSIFHYISEDRVPLGLYGKALKNMLLSPEKEQ